MTSVEILYWHDIPVQVRARQRRVRHSQLLPGRFQQAVDNAAMAAGLTSADAYSEGFHWQPAGEREGTPDEVAEAVAAELEARYPKIDWRATAERLRQS
jgi:hypothetical protein